MLVCPVMFATYDGGPTVRAGVLTLPEDPRLEASRLARLAAAEAERGSTAEATQLLRAAVQLLDFGAARGTARRDKLRIGPDARWFERVDGSIASLARSGAPCRILRALVELRLSAPGAALDCRTVFSIGWPNERIAPSSAQRRVYSAIWTLRRLGLGDVIGTNDDGYLIDPGVEIMSCGRLADQSRA